MTGRFDPELFLRVAGERAMLNPERHAGFPRGIRPVAMASAFCAVGLLDQATARMVIRDYLTALALRKLHHGHISFPDSADERDLTVDLRPEPVAACNGTMRIRGVGKLVPHYVVFGEDRARIEVDLIGSDTLPSPSVTVTDGHNNSARGVLNLSGHAGNWRGQLVTDRPLAPDSPTLRLNRTAVPLRPAVHVPVTLEELPVESPAEQHLRMAVAAAVAGRGWFHNMADNLEATYEAFFAAGVMDAESPTLAELRAVAATFPLRPDQPPPRPGLPDPWRSLAVRRDAGPGPEGSAAIGVVTPPIGGVTVRMDGLVTRTEGFEVRVTTSPAVDITHANEMDPAPRPEIVWWAHDNLDGHYIGGMGNVWSAGHGVGTGAIRYRPPLNPRARTLTLTPTGRTSRAVVILNDLPWATK